MSLQDLEQASRRAIAIMIKNAADYGLASQSLTANATTPISRAIAACARGVEKRAGEAATAGKEIQAPGILRNGASAAWRMSGGGQPVKTTRPSSGGGSARSMPTAKPPNKTAYFTDTIQSLNNPQRGSRQTKLDS